MPYFSSRDISAIALSIYKYGKNVRAIPRPEFPPGEVRGVQRSHIESAEVQMGGREREVGDIILAPETEYMRFCPRCRAKVPTNIKCCWGCGEVLDPRLIELAKSIKKKEAEGR